MLSSSSIALTPLLLQVVVQLGILLPNHSVTSDCLCPGDNVVLQSDYVWKESEFYGFDPNITCQALDDYVTNMGCFDPKELREVCCIDYDRPSYICAKAVRDTILSNDYDILVAPALSASFDPVNVTVILEYQAVTEIDIAAGTVEIFVWFTMTWRDPRLAWTYDPATTCTTYPVAARASMGGNSEIWVPELDLFNRASGTRSMGDSPASVYQDGRVVWARDGSIKAICSFVNLGQIPFDKLGCQFMFGSISTKDSSVRYLLDPDEALRIGDFSSPYSEYILESASPGVNVTEEFGIHNIFFDFYFVRGTSFYMINVVLPVSIFSILSICTMTLGFNSFQRIALNLTLLLVAVAQKISISKLLPVTDKSLWIVDYIAHSFIWIAVTLFQSVVVTVMAALREIRKMKQEKGEILEGILDAEINGDPPGHKSRSTETKEGVHWFFTFSLKTFDLVCFACSLFCYLIYVIVMFASRNTWGNSEVENTFLWANTTTTS
jgi:hypothetical protein